MISAELRPELCRYPEDRERIHSTAGRIKKLWLKPCPGPLTSTLKSTPPHHQRCSPGKVPLEEEYFTIQEAYEFGMRAEPNWESMSSVIWCANRDLYILFFSGKLEIFIRDDSQRGVRAKTKKELADNSDDKKRLFKVEARTGRKLKASSKSKAKKPSRKGTYGLQNNRVWNALGPQLPMATVAGQLQGRELAQAQTVRTQTSVVGPCFQ